MKRTRADAHVHLLDEPILGHKNIEPLSAYGQYFDSNNIETAFVVFNNPDMLEELKQMCSNTNIHGFYWMHTLEDGIEDKIPDIAECIKFESYIDGIDVSEIAPILDAQKLPVYIHCGELKSNLANPEKVRALAEQYPDRRFIIGHAGAYAPPIDEKYLKGLEISERVRSAIDVAEKCENVFLETSILENRQKAGIIANALKDGCIADKILLGTDYPLTIGDILGNVPAREKIKSYQPTIISQEKILADELSKYMERNIAMEIIGHLYQNTAGFFGK